MNSIKSNTAKIQQEALERIRQAKTLQELDALRIEYLGRKGKIAHLMDELSHLSLKEKRELGPIINSCKQACQQAYESKKEELTTQKFSASEAKKRHFDPTAYVPKRLHGTLHPMTHIQNEIEEVFLSMGYDIADGPEVETEFYNFEALKIPSDHPARDMWDTLWLDVPGLLLRTHTSSVQIHTMHERTPPFAVVAPGRCYRHEATDATHDFQFMQVEGVLIDKDIALSHLLATIESFLHLFFNKKLAIRVRPSYFPFVEPGIEMDIECPFCNHGCSLCKDTEWIEMCGAGLIHPNVLESCGIDNKHYKGFAFGFGLTRLAMLKYKINDIRLLHANHVSFLQQF